MIKIFFKTFEFAIKKFLKSQMIENNQPLSFITGWLDFYSSLEKVVRKLFCMVNSEILTISLNETQDNIILQISTNDIISVQLDDFDESTVDNNHFVYYFTIFLAKESYKFGCESLTQAKKWIVVLTSHKEKNMKLKMPKLSDFTIISKIGCGHSGEVLLAKHIKTNQYYALKSIPKENIYKSKVARAISERNILMEASHPFITRLISTFQTDERLFLVLEFIQGGDLLFHINQGLRLSPETIRLYLAEIATALSYLHHLGVVFRDLKPSNILIGKDGHLKLTDFGLSRYLIDDSVTKSFCGTSEYIAPEMIKNQGYGFAVDWWAFGVLAYLLFEGILPFRSLNLSRLYNQITSSPLKFMKKLPDDTTDFIQKLLIKDPECRLGCGKQGDSEIFDHPFFKDIIWKDVYYKKYDPDFKPYSGDYNEMNYNFDKSVTSQCPDSCKIKDVKCECIYQIQGFSFTDFNEISSYVSNENCEPNATLIHS